MAASESAAQPPTIIIQHRGRPGFLAGVLACVFGVLGIFVSGILFIPLAVICSIVGFWRGIAGKSPEGIGTSLLGGFLSVIGFAVSPTLSLLTGALLLTHEIASSNGIQALPDNRAQQAQKNQQAAVTLENLVQRMQHFDGMAETDIAGLPVYRARMQQITAKMRGYLQREKELNGDPNAIATRGQLFVAVTQGSVATDQLRMQVQPLESVFQTKVLPLMQTVVLAARDCRAALQIRAISDARIAACRDVSNALPVFTQDFQNLRSNLEAFNALDAQAKGAQLQLVRAAETAQ